MQLREVEESLRRRHPDSVSNLIRAAQPDSSLVEDLARKTKKIDELEKERSDLTEEFQKKLRSFRTSTTPLLRAPLTFMFYLSRVLKQEHERLRFEQEKRNQLNKLELGYGVDRGKTGQINESGQESRKKGGSCSLCLGDASVSLPPSSLVMCTYARTSLFLSS
jgi:DNA repair exonuclease SbcCD ATPase subunit